MATKKTTTTKKTPAGRATAKKASAKKAPKTAAKTSAAKAPTKKAPAKKAQAKKPAAAKPKASASKGEAKAKKVSAIDAAAKVLADSKRAMTSKEMIEAMAARKLWTSPGGKTPHATLYSAILREIARKGKDARFKKTERGKFALNTTK